MVEGLFLSSFSGRKLGLASTGNADGFYNLRLTSTVEGGDWEAMLRMLGDGLGRHPVPGRQDRSRQRQLDPGGARLRGSRAGRWRMRSPT
ncbi:hypothetical protein ACRAWD_02380 [Caulobacter segnis]